MRLGVRNGDEVNLYSETLQNNGQGLCSSLFYRCNIVKNHFQYRETLQNNVTSVNDVTL